MANEDEGRRTEYKWGETEEQRLGVFLERSILPVSRAKYLPTWRKWKSYIASLPESQNPGVYLERISDRAGKSKALVMFYAYLFDVLGKRDKQISTISSHLRFYLGLHGCPTEFFDDALAVQGRRAGRRSVEETEAYLELRERTKLLPLGDEVVAHMRQVLWTDTSWKIKKEVDQKAIWIAILLGFDSGKRVSNLTVPDGPLASPHGIKARHVLVSLRDGQGRKRTVIGGEAFRKYEGCEYEVLSLRLMYMTTKTSDNQVVLQASDVGDAGVIRDLVEWMMLSEVRSDDVLTSHRRTRNAEVKGVTSKSVRYAIKASCSFFGLDEKRFSTSSMRKGFATMYSICGGNAEYRNLVGGWAAGSKIPQKHYIHAGPKGVFSVAAQSGVGLSVEDMALMGGGLDSSIERV